MALKELVEKYLEEQPLFRERSRKDKGIVTILLKLTRYEKLRDDPDSQTSKVSGAVPKTTLIEFVQDYATMDRAWRKATAENPQWRGTDYGDKEELETKAQRELGYNV